MVVYLWLVPVVTCKPSRKPLQSAIKFGKYADMGKDLLLTFLLA